MKRLIAYLILIALIVPATDVYAKWARDKNTGRYYEIKDGEEAPEVRKKKARPRRAVRRGNSQRKAVRRGKSPLKAVRRGKGPRKTVYIALKGGWFLPNNENFSDSDREYNGMRGFSTGYNAELAIGLNIIKYMAAEISVGYYYTNYAKDDLTISMGTIPANLTLLLMIPIDVGDNEVSPFVGAGAGYYGVRANSTQSSHNYTYYASTYGYHGVGGFDYFFGNIGLGVEAKYSQAYAYINKNVTNMNVGGITVNLSLKFRF